jgi:hypothetical protein
MGVSGFIESFPNGDVGIITQTPYNEIVVKLNSVDFQSYLSELIHKAKKMGIYKCDCDKQSHNAPSCPIRKPSKPIDAPNPKTHAIASEDAECKS